MTTNGNHAPDLDKGCSLPAPSTMHRADSLSISPELFEKLYLSPQNRVAGDLRKTFGNPSPLATAGFLLSLTPLSCILMGWRGASGGGASNIGAIYAFGGVLTMVGSVQEWILGNTFPAVVFGTFSAFWIALAMTLQPFYNAYGAFATDGQPAASGLQSVGFNASQGFFLLWMGVLSFVYLVAALRTNVIFVLIFATLAPAFGLLGAADWYVARAFGGGDEAADLRRAHDVTVGAGALLFVTSLLGWWLFLVQVLAAVDFPYTLPVGDLSQVVKGRAQKVARMEKEE